jgi:PP-loop superfamily ATP-utilizing enzyme
VGVPLKQVRDLARHMGLPNWSHAASPCLRSRLAWGVAASEAHLRLVEQAELEVRRRVPLQVRRLTD